MKWRILGLGFIALAACQTTAETEQQVAEQAEGVVRLEPQLPTGVHLQATFLLPDELDGMTTTHEEMRYLVYLPRAYDDEPSRRWPLIYFLHGAGDQNYESTFVLSFGLPAVLLAGEQPENFPFVVVSPQAFPGGTWWDDEALPALDALLQEVLDVYRVDPDRVYLTGLSMGGYGAWYLATTYPERFAAMASISGSGYRTLTIPSEETLCRMENMAVWAIHGAQDAISDPEISRLNTMALKASCQGEVTWTLYDDVGHIGAYDRAYRDPELYQWMLEHSRTAPAASKD